MKKIINFNTPYDFDITRETVGGFVLRAKALKSDGVDVDGNPILVPAPIYDLNKINIEVDLIRQNGHEKKIMRGYLMDNILGLYAQTVKYALVLKQTTEGYLLFIDWKPFAAQLQGEDKLRVRLNVASTAFSNVRTMDSVLEFQTMTAKQGTNMIPVIKSYPIGKDKETIDMDLGSGVVKIVAATDFANDYLSSTEAKLVSGDLRAQGNFEKPFDAMQLLVENAHMFDNNPESDVEDLVIYQGQPLDSVKLRATLSKGALQNAKIITVSWERI